MEEAPSGVRRSPTVWVMAATLIPGLVLTHLARTLYPQWWQLVGCFWYSIPRNSFIGLPHEPAVVYAGALYHPTVVVIARGLATMVV